MAYEFLLSANGNPYIDWSEMHHLHPGQNALIAQQSKIQVQVTFMVVLYSDEAAGLVPWGRRMEPAARLLQAGIERKGHSREGMGHDREYVALAVKVAVR